MTSGRCTLPSHDSFPTFPTARIRHWMKAFSSSPLYEWCVGMDLESYLVLKNMQTTASAVFTFPKPRCIVLTLSAYTANLASFLVMNLWQKLEICPMFFSLLAGLVVKDTCHMFLFWWKKSKTPNIPKLGWKLTSKGAKTGACCPYVLWGHATRGQRCQIMT